MAGQTIRLNRFIAQAGVCSRRKADFHIDSGDVKVNGQKVYELGVKVDPDRDRVEFQGKHIQVNSEKLYLAFYKPRHVVTTLHDPEDRPCIGDYLKKMKTRVYPVGRLDWDSEGLLILTNDGDYSERVLSPKGAVPKTYKVKISQSLTENQIGKLQRGVSIEGGGRVRVDTIRRLKPPKGDTKVGRSMSTDAQWVEVIISEGKNRQIRKMFEKLRIDVQKLQRVAIGRLKIGTLKPGELRPLNERQVRMSLQGLEEQPQRHFRKTKIQRRTRK
ncbi:MAG: rRNA pseudouridine synthase [Bdellovibrionales bacterium CG10_big_fil_rev_8_21_14_0_10_45_34]|nr:MAG: rRNA pseudouridine synthase [Bdellovibrionales bacterium CG10_big_fil_rev_8_21_14_0_10_45_34]